MRSHAIRLTPAALAIAGLLWSLPALAQQQQQEPVTARPYKKVSVEVAPPVSDPSFEAFRQQLTDIVQRKDRAALGALIVPKGFFWERETGNTADESKSGLDNFAAATGLDAEDGSGWD